MEESSSSQPLSVAMVLSRVLNLLCPNSLAVKVFGSNLAIQARQASTRLYRSPAATLAWTSSLSPAGVSLLDYRRVLGDHAHAVVHPTTAIGAVSSRHRGPFKKRLLHGGDLGPGRPGPNTTPDRPPSHLSTPRWPKGWNITSTPFTGCNTIVTA